jgi:hypothetical protein
MGETDLGVLYWRDADGDVRPFSSMEPTARIPTSGIHTHTQFNADVSPVIEDTVQSLRKQNEELLKEVTRLSSMLYTIEQRLGRLENSELLFL